MISRPRAVHRATLQPDRPTSCSMMAERKVSLWVLVVFSSFHSTRFFILAFLYFCLEVEPSMPPCSQARTKTIHKPHNDFDDEQVTCKTARTGDTPTTLIITGRRPHSSGLFQQLVVDYWAIKESGDLTWYRQNQDSTRADLFSGGG